MAVAFTLALYQLDTRNRCNDLVACMRAFQANALARTRISVFIRGHKRIFAYQLLEDTLSTQLEYRMCLCS